jgi:hypothetical protein
MTIFFATSIIIDFVCLGLIRWGCLPLFFFITKKIQVCMGVLEAVNTRRPTDRFSARDRALARLIADELTALMLQRAQEVARRILEPAKMILGFVSLFFTFQVSFFLPFFLSTKSSVT